MSGTHTIVLRILRAPGNTTHILVGVATHQLGQSYKESFEFGWPGNVSLDWLSIRRHFFRQPLHDVPLPQPSFLSSCSSSPHPSLSTELNKDYEMCSARTSRDASPLVTFGELDGEVCHQSIDVVVAFGGQTVGNRECEVIFSNSVKIHLLGRRRKGGRGEEGREGGEEEGREGEREEKREGEGRVAYSKL